MSRRICCVGTNVLFCSLLFFTACQHRSGSEANGFTKADSLTETYLALQDTMLRAWNTMMYDDNRKIKAMHHLLDELQSINPEVHDEVRSLRERLDHLSSMRYNQTSITNPELVSEYDFASNSLVAEIISLAEGQKQFPYNETLQKLSDSIRASDQRVMSYRREYDRTASRFNTFIERYKELLKEIDSQNFVQKKPLFEMAAD